MSPQDLTNLVAAAAVVMLAINVLLLVRSMRRQARQIRLLTRRVWILEGRSHGNADQAELELDSEDRHARGFNRSGWLVR